MGHGVICSSVAPHADPAELVRFRGAELDVAGDGLLRAGSTSRARAVRCACAITEAIPELGTRNPRGITYRRVRDHGRQGRRDRSSHRRPGGEEAQPGEIPVPSTVRDLVAGWASDFEERGVAELKGVPGEWRLYAVAERTRQ